MCGISRLRISRPVYAYSLMVGSLPNKKERRRAAPKNGGTRYSLSPPTPQPSPTNFFFFVLFFFFFCLRHAHMHACMNTCIMPAFALTRSLIHTQHSHPTQGILSLRQDFLRVGLRSTRSLLLYSAVFSVVAAYSSSLSSLIFNFNLFMVLYYMLLRRHTWSLCKAYIQYCLGQDLKDIEHYYMRPRRHFWVAVDSSSGESKRFASVFMLMWSVEIPFIHSHTYICVYICTCIYIYFFLIPNFILLFLPRLYLLHVIIKARFSVRWPLMKKIRRRQNFGACLSLRRLEAVA